MEEHIFTTYHSLILGALKKCHITPLHKDFDDYLQLARIELLLAYRLYEENPDEHPPFRPFVYQKIYWSTLDAIRKEQRRFDKDNVEDSFVESIPQDDDISCCLTTTDFYYELIKTLSTDEQHFLNDRFFEQLTISQIAHKHNVARQTVYRWRDGVRKKYQKIEKKV
ncbi:sigma-70 family RNA polymerase sigma factor [Vagococcus bubulae]|uniref:RNA polymerase sigma-70 region 2 domain-containing protein n=1 Tax=Vagococcus bubulae TaxID=1977868 RepID=A0A429ZIR0_9ENTE|nr:sigma-70 family RNA polymerase sigma factor [Vagococcus bubulae]RST93577.1 hypothetical protein CBF36_07060 [Vagococcus bubulae]